jgi:hypothetical protein
LLPQAGLFGALFLAFAAALPSATEARIAGLQFVDFKSDVSANCTVRPAGRTWIRGAPPVQRTERFAAATPARQHRRQIECGARCGNELPQVAVKRFPIHAQVDGWLAARLGFAPHR